MQLRRERLKKHESDMKAGPEEKRKNRQRKTERKRQARRVAQIVRRLLISYTLPLSGNVMYWYSKVKSCAFISSRAVNLAPKLSDPPLS